MLKIWELPEDRGVTEIERLRRFLAVATNEIEQLREEVKQLKGEKETPRPTGCEPEAVPVVPPIVDLTTAKLVNLSICSCGFPTLADHITLGTEFQINRSCSQRLILLCGGCGNAIPVECVFVDGEEPGFLPEEIFEDC